MLVEQAKAVTDFTEKTKYADQAMLILDNLKLLVPYIVKKETGTAIMGTNNLKSQVESKFGKVTSSEVIIYKKYSVAESQTGGTTANPVTKDFTLFSIYLYNPLSENTNIYLIEDKQAANWSEDPAYIGGVTIWEITLTPGEIRKVSYQVEQLIDIPISTQVYEVIPESKIAIPEETGQGEIEEEPKDLIGQIINFFAGIEDFLKGLLP
jgi:hypothetical protein